jgi:hypothetical protein
MMFKLNVRVFIVHFIKSINLKKLRANALFPLLNNKKHIFNQFCPTALRYCPLKSNTLAGFELGSSVPEVAATAMSLHHTVRGAKMITSSKLSEA